MGWPTTRGREWSGREIRTVARLYPKGGAKACAPELPDRSICAIYAMANSMDIVRVGVHRGRKASAR